MASAGRRFASDVVHENALALCTASSEARLFFRTLIWVFKDGWPRLLCNFLRAWPFGSKGESFMRQGHMVAPVLGQALRQCGYLLALGQPNTRSP